MKQNIQNIISLLARQTAKQAKRDPSLNDLADMLYVFAVKIGVSKEQLPR